MKILIAIFIMIMGMSLESSAQTTLSASKKVYGLSPSAIQPTTTTTVRPPISVTTIISTTLRGAKELESSGFNSDVITIPTGKAKSGNNNSSTTMPKSISNKKIKL